MKLLFTAIAVSLLLASCSESATKMNSQQEAVTNYLKKTLDDPASYQPVRWGKVQAWRQRDEARSNIESSQLELSTDSMDAASGYRNYQAAVQFAKTAPTYSLNKSDIARNKAKWQHATHAVDSLRKRIDSLLAVKDTTRLGYLITHAFRAKNKTGGLVLDSAQFEIQDNGQVRVWNDFKD